MSSGIPSTNILSDCCQPACQDQTSGQIPGPKGDTGSNGTNGVDGVNAFTTTTANFTMPASLATAVATVVNSTWATIGQIVFLQNCGWLEVTAKTDSTHITLKNLETATNYTDNVAPGTVVAPANSISPAGEQGPAGSSAGITLNSLSPTTAKGDIIVDNGAGGGSANDVKLGAGANGKSLVADSSQATGLNYTFITPTSATDNAIARYDGASGTPVPLQTSKVIVTDNGAVQASGSGGNARGADAVDLQVVRGAANEVASGTESVVSGGNANKSSADNSTVGGGIGNVASGIASTVGGGAGNTASNSNAAITGGQNNTASNTNTSVIGGTGNTASGGSASCLGGDSNLASGNDSATIGGNSNVASTDYAVSFGADANADHYAQSAQAAGKFSVDGDAQASDLVMRGITANSTPTEIFLDGSSARLTIPSDTTWAFRMMIVARRADANDESAAYQLLGCIDRNSAAATTALVGSVGKTVIAEDIAGWDVNATADTTNGALILTVTGENAKTVNWVCKCELVQLTA